MGKGSGVALDGSPVYHRVCVSSGGLGTWLKGTSAVVAPSP